MIERRALYTLTGEDRSWLKARHHIAFTDVPDGLLHSWGALRAWNDDEIAPGTGFPPHGHVDMEIITYVRDGAITHEDSLGHRGRTVAGDVQVMSAGAGIRHSEYNLEPSVTRLFQIWIAPERPLRRASSRVTAFDTVALERNSSDAAALKDCISATFAKMASPSKSGSLRICVRKYDECDPAA